MKPLFLAGVVALSGMSGIAEANCTNDTLITSANLTALFSNNLVCGRPGANYPGQGGAASTDRWQEQHTTGGQLVDYKKGPTDTVDPSKTVGSWSIIPGNRLVHTYTGGPTFSWQVRRSANNTYSFCTSGAEHVVAFILPGAGTMGCAGQFP